MRYVWLVTLVLALALTGCAKKNTANPAPAHAPNDNSGTAGNPNAVAPGGGTAGGGTAGGGAAGGGAAQQPAGGGTAQQPAGGGAAAKPEQLPQMTRAQYDKIVGAIKFDEVTKIAGSSGKLIGQTGGKKTYEYQLKDDPKYYVDIVFDQNGIMSEKSLFAK
ncbi:hypothetical protein [Gordoniibacillus kamchatkensis]|nr:hypothetical protein [Paenibacillus sp. VKM B-2647]